MCINDFSESQNNYRTSSYRIISIFAYLIGVPERIFENEHEPPQLDHYERLEKLTKARIIRNLCILRTALEQNFSAVSNAMRYELKGLSSLPEYIPQHSLNQLREDGITIEKANKQTGYYIITINQQICNHINNCRDLFPTWVQWDYLRELFIMPNGLTDEGIRQAASCYYANKASYPYQVYMNWGSFNHGNILYNDKKFLELLYEQHQDCFADMSKVTDASNMTKNGLFRFLEENDRVDVIVDCENSDPYKLCAVIENFDQQELLAKIKKIILIDDCNTSIAWQILQNYTKLEIERIQTERLKAYKSIVDHTLICKVAKEYYRENIKNFILVSSDSDFWALISEMKDVNFYWMLEKGKTARKLCDLIAEKCIGSCFIDDFCTGNSDIKNETISKVLKQNLKSMHFNLKQLLENACLTARASMSDGEKQEFFNRFLKYCRLEVDANGEARIVY